MRGNIDREDWHILNRLKGCVRDHCGETHKDCIRIMNQNINFMGQVMNGFE